MTGTAVAQQVSATVAEAALATDRCAMKVTTASHLVLDFQQNLCKEGNLLCAAVSKKQ
jgi:hypothetical protein